MLMHGSGQLIIKFCKLNLFGATSKSAFKEV